MDDLYGTWVEEVRTVAQITAREWPDSDVEDIEQSIWEGILVVTKTGGTPTKKGLFWIAKRYCFMERRNHLTISSQYAYRTPDVRALLETFFDREDWRLARVPEDAESELANVGVEMSSDLSRCWGKLALQYQRTLFCKFALRETVENKKVDRALRRLTDILNTYETPPAEYTGCRPVIPISTAVAITGGLT